MSSRSSGGRGHRRPEAAGVLSRLKRIIEKHNLLVDSAQCLMSLGSFFLPLGGANSEIVFEGVAALTNMIGLTSDFTRRHDVDELDNPSTLLHYFMLLLVQTEVLLEKLASRCDMHNDASIKYMTIMYLELVKSGYRLFLLFFREKKASMLIQWGRGSSSSPKFIYSLESYRVYLDKLSTRSSPPLADFFSSWDLDVEAVHRSQSRRNQTRRFCSKGTNIGVTNPGAFECRDKFDSNYFEHRSDKKNSNKNYNDDVDNYETNNDDKDIKCLPWYQELRYRSWDWYRHFSPYEKVPCGTQILKQSQRLFDIGLDCEQLLLLGETLYVLRPAVYSTLLYGSCKVRRSKRKARAAMALAVSMVMEVLSLICTSKALEITEQDYPASGHGNEGFATEMHPVQEELRRRKTAFLFNILRSPVMNRATLPILSKVAKLLRHLPLIGSLPPKILDLLQYFSGTYFYTSNSS